MGLDMWIRRVRKPEIENKKYTTSEIYDMNLNMLSVRDANRDSSMFAQLLPYTVMRNVLTEYYNRAKMIADYNLPEDSYISMYSQEGIRLHGTNKDGTTVSQFISNADVEEKYTLIESVPHYIWSEDEVAYWRKHYKLQDWFYEHIEGVENCGYYILDANLITEMNAKFNESVSEEDPTDEEALFYHEWY